MLVSALRVPKDAESPGPTITVSCVNSLSAGFQTQDSLEEQQASLTLDPSLPT